MDYISVGEPNSSTGERINKYFNNYLISFGEIQHKKKNDKFDGWERGGKYMQKILDDSDIAQAYHISQYVLKHGGSDDLKYNIAKFQEIREKNERYKSEKHNKKLYRGGDVLRSATEVINHPDAKQIPKRNLYIDSGGFQIIMNYFGTAVTTNNSILPFIQVYHNVLSNPKFHDRIHKIFSLDVNNISFSKEDIYKFNKISILMSIDIIKKYESVKNKQLFVLQTRNRVVFDIWKKLFIEFEVYKYYKLWSFGGLVGLKKDTAANFSHAIPATLWLLTYQKKYKFPIEQIHFLGQGSKLNFISMGLLEKLFGLNMTSDSSQLVRFAKIDHKFPLTYQIPTDHTDRHDDVKANFGLIEEVNSLIDTTFEHYEDNDRKLMKDEFSKGGKFNNADFSEVLSQSTHADMHFGEIISKEIIEFGIDKINVDDIRGIHPILKRGRLATEVMNNINYIKIAIPFIREGNTDHADKMMYAIFDKYEADEQEKALKKEEMKKKKNKE